MAGSSNPQKPASTGANLATHPLVQQSLGTTHDSFTTAWVTLTGYIGPSPNEDHIRLYLGLDFQTYYEIPRGDIGNAEHVDRQDEKSPTHLRVKAEAQVELVQVRKMSGPASYVLGEIAGTHMGGAIQAQGSALREVMPIAPTMLPCTVGCPQGLQPQNQALGVTTGAPTWAPCNCPQNTHGYTNCAPTWAPCNC